MTIFLGEKALSHAKNISIPRLPGSSGEKKAVNYIKNKLKEIGWDVKEEEFFIPLTPWLLLRTLVFLALFLIIISRLLFFSIPILCSAITLLTALCFIFSLRIWLFISHLDLFHRKKRGIKTENIVASLNEKMSSRKKRLFLIAHHDSKSQNISLPARALITLFLVISLIFSSFLYISFYLKPEVIDIYHALNILTIFSVICLLPLLFLRTENKSAGSLDNASSIGILLELAEILKKNPTKNIGVFLLFTGAEEHALIGASAFLNRHLSKLNQDKDLFLNLDAAINNRIMVSLSRKKDKELISLMKEISKERGIKLSYIPFLPGLLMDHISFSYKNLKAASLYSISKKSRFIHTYKDTSLLLDKEGLKNTGQLIEGVIRRLDRKGIPIKVDAYSGYISDQRPNSFVLNDKKYTIKEIISMTKEEDLDRTRIRRFMVKTETDETYNIYYDEELKQWFLVK